MINRDDFKLIQDWKEAVRQDDHRKHSHEENWYSQLIDDVIDGYFEDVYAYLRKVNARVTKESCYSILSIWIRINNDNGVCITNKYIDIDYDKMLSLDDFLTVRKWWCYLIDNDSDDVFYDNYDLNKRRLQRYGIPYPNEIQIYRSLADQVRDFDKDE